MRICVAVVVIAAGACTGAAALPWMEQSGADAGRGDVVCGALTGDPVAIDRARIRFDHDGGADTYGAQLVSVRPGRAAPNEDTIEDESLGAWQDGGPYRVDIWVDGLFDGPFPRCLNIGPYELGDAFLDGDTHIVVAVGAGAGRRSFTSLRAVARPHQAPAGNLLILGTNDDGLWGRFLFTGAEIVRDATGVRYVDGSFRDFSGEFHAVRKQHDGGP